MPPLTVVEEWYGGESSGKHTVQYLTEYLKEHRKRNLITVRVLGNGGVGKSTFIKAMKHFAETREVLSPTGNHNITKGISIVEAKVNDLTLRFVEFGGQPQYLPIHRAFLDATSSVFVVLYRADTDGDDGYKSALFWMNYVASISRPGDQQEQDPIFLCSTFNDQHWYDTNATDLMARIKAADESTMHSIAQRFRLEEDNAYDVNYDTLTAFESCYSTLCNLATSQWEAAPEMPSSYLDFLDHCREMAKRENSQVLSIESVQSSFTQMTGHREEAIRGAMKVLTQFGDIVSIPEMTHVYTNPHLVFYCAAKIMDGIKNEENELGSAQDVVGIVSEMVEPMQDVDDQAKNLLFAMCVLNLCYPVSDIDVSFLRLGITDPAPAPGYSQT